MELDRIVILQEGVLYIVEINVQEEHGINVQKGIRKFVIRDLVNVDQHGGGIEMTGERGYMATGRFLLAQS